MQDKNAEVELTDDELRDLIASVEDVPVLTKEREDAMAARLEPAIDAAITRETSRPRPFHVGISIPGKRKTGSSAE